MPASIREAIFLSFIMVFSSLWCIKDRDPKQVKGWSFSFRKHYNIPPPVSSPSFAFSPFCFIFFRGIFAPRGMPLLLPSQSQSPDGACASSPAGGAKCQPVGKGQVGGKEKPRKTSPYHKLWVEERTCTCLPLRGRWTGYHCKCNRKKE